MRAAIIFGLVIVLTLIISVESHATDVTIQAQNRLEYYLDREADSLGAHSDSLRNRLVVDLLYGSFYGGIWFEAFHPIEQDTSFQGITQRYFGWTDGNAEVRVGNYYASFNKGLILRSYESEDVQIDRNIEGIWGRYRAEKYNFEALTGKILLQNPLAQSPLIRDRNNDIVGFRGELTPIRQVRFGGAALRYTENDPLFGTSHTNAQEVAFGFTHGVFDLYANYARQQGTTSLGLMRFDGLDEGDGAYITAAISTGLIGIAAEYKNYYNMGLDINAPPAANHRNQSANAFTGANGADERGFQISTFFAPFGSWTFEASVAQSSQRPDSETGHAAHYIYNNFYEARGYIGRHILIFNYERADMGLEGIEHLPYGEFTYYIDNENTITMTGQVKKYEKVISGKPDYNETDFSIAFSHSYFITLTLFGGFTSEEFSEREEGFPERSGAISLSLRYGEHDLNIFYGDQRGGFVCAEGTCREVPPFRGLKTTLVSRF